MLRLLCPKDNFDMPKMAGRNASMTMPHMMGRMLFVIICLFISITGAQANSITNRAGQDLVIAQLSPQIPVWENSALPAIPSYNAGQYNGQSGYTGLNGRQISNGRTVGANTNPYANIRQNGPELFGIETQSRLEEFYSRRSYENLHQFGYRALGSSENQNAIANQTGAARAGRSSDIPRNGAVSEDFVVGRGDRLRIVFTGQVFMRKVFNVDSQGQIIIDELGPIPAAGRKMSDIRAEIAALAASHHNLNVFVSIDSVQQISVLFLGHVANPGKHNISAFDGLLEGLVAAGGIEKTGSLRRIKIIRQGKALDIDLYHLLLNDDVDLDLSLRDGDRVIIPPIGPSFAVSGAVKRPGIYELPGKNTRISMDQALDLAGGLLANGRNRMVHLAVQNDGSETTQDIPENLLKKSMISDASMLLIERQQDNRTGEITLSGHTTAPGTYDLKKTPTLGKLLHAPSIFGPDIYALLGIIERKDADHLGKNWIAFAPYLVSRGEFDRSLQNGDVVHLFSSQYMRQWMSEKPAADAIAGQNTPRNGQLNNQAIAQRATLFAQDGNQGAVYDNPEFANLNANLSGPAGAPSRQGGRSVLFDYSQESDLALRDIDPELFRFLKDYALSIRGAVRAPGLYPVAEGISLTALITSAGGLLVQADQRHIEITSRLPDIEGLNKAAIQNAALPSAPANAGDNTHNPSQTGIHLFNSGDRFAVDLTNPHHPTILLGPGDSVRVHDNKSQNIEKTVLLKGEVKYPGAYDLAPGDRLSDLIQRAGGLTDQAYPIGTVFSRASERQREEVAFRAQAQELELSLAQKIEQGERGRSDKSPDIEEIRSVQKLVARLKNASALGRITVEANPQTLKNQPDLDILLEAGDRIYIPKRPLHVRVRGEVLSPANLQFRNNKDADDYIRQAGGFTERADKQRSFVIYPDGSAQPLHIGPWTHDDILIPPGSTVVVPVDSTRFSFLERARDISQILTNLTISAVFLDDLNDGN